MFPPYSPSLSISASSPQQTHHSIIATTRKVRASFDTVRVDYMSAEEQDRKGLAIVTCTGCGGGGEMMVGGEEEIVAYRAFSHGCR